MKIAILNDNTIESWIGGAALVNDRIKTGLEEQGHIVDIIVCRPDKNEWKTELIFEYDFFILANFAYFPRDDITYIYNHRRFITFRHDIPIILYTQPQSIFYKNMYEDWQLMFDKAELIIFISPLQYKVFKYNFKIKDNFTIIPPPLKIDGFQNENYPTREGNLYLGDISDARGIRETLKIMKQTNPDGPHVFAGKMVQPDLKQWLFENGAEYIGEIKHENVCEIMNIHENFYYYPKIYDSFCLKIVEAELCGMTIYSDYMRIGRYYYEDSPEELKQQINTDSLEFILSLFENEKK